MANSTTGPGALQKQYELVFGQPWPVIPAALLVGTLNVFLFAFDRPWTASDGLRNWGDWLFHLLGIVHRPDLISPLLYSGSILNLGLLLGAFAAALLSREFGIKPAPMAELIKGGIGGVMMGGGAVLSFGCNIGGFFSALPALSLSGLTMMLGLGIGAFMAAKYLSGKIDGAGSDDFQAACESPPRTSSGSFGAQPLIGLLVLLTLLGVAHFYRVLGYAPQGAFLLFGVAFGFVFQRSRFCFVRAFREPFVSGDSVHTRAAALALALSVIGFSILKATDLKDSMDWVFPSFWLGALLGGSLFGAGMAIAGGCGAGSIWRAGEGQVKLWVAVFFFAVGASMMRQFLVHTDLIRRLGSAIFIPNAIGWAGALWSVVVLMALWYLLCGWNEQHKQAGMLKL